MTNIIEGKVLGTYVNIIMCMKQLLTGGSGSDYKTLPLEFDDE